MTIDEAISELVEFRRIYGSDYDLAISVKRSNWGEATSAVKVLGIKRLADAMAWRRFAVLTPSCDLVSMTYHLDAIEKARNAK